MSHANAARLIAGTLVAVVLFCQPVAAQTSIGFADPQDISDLLAYRLPDWGYRVWDLDFSLGGSGTDSYFGDPQQSASNSFRTGLDSAFTLYRESERRTYRILVDGSGRYQRGHTASGDRESSGHTLGANLLLGGRYTKYLGDGPFSLRVGGDTRQLYSENIQDSRIGDDEEELRNFGRSHRYNLDLGAGIGRVRDVTPLIRAQRLSERLTALGRPPLTPGQVQTVAKTLATEEGYRLIFDRPEKDFWRDVLQPMLDPDHPLSPYEVYYLREIMEEDIGPRRQGTVLQAVFRYLDEEAGADQDETRRIRRGPALDFLWSRNLSMDHQLSLGAGVDYTWLSGPGPAGETGRAALNLDYLWTIADRYRWDTGLTVEGVYEESADDTDRSIRRQIDTRLSSIFTVFVENTVSLNFRVDGSNHQETLESTFQDLEERYGRRWSWSYGIGLSYLLDGFLY